MHFSGDGKKIASEILDWKKIPGLFEMSFAWADFSGAAAVAGQGPRQTEDCIIIGLLEVPSLLHSKQQQSDWPLWCQRPMSPAHPRQLLRSIDWASGWTEVSSTLESCPAPGKVEKSSLFICVAYISLLDTRIRYRLGGLNNRNLFFSQFWRLDIWDQAVRDLISLAALP